MPTRSAKILMVDDRPENLLALEAILQSLGHELIKASSGEEALKCLLIHDVAVILLDVRCPAWMVSRPQGTSNGASGPAISRSFF